MKTVSSPEEETITTSWHRLGAVANQRLLFHLSPSISWERLQLSQSTCQKHQRDGFGSGAVTPGSPSHFNDLMGAGKVTAEGRWGALVISRWTVQICQSKWAKSKTDKGQIPNTHWLNGKWLHWKQARFVVYVIISEFVCVFKLISSFLFWPFYLLLSSFITFRIELSWCHPCLAAIYCMHVLYCCPC